MCLRVLLTISSCSESLSTFFTFEGLFTNVDFLVSFQVGRLLTVNEGKVVVNISKGFVAAWMHALVKFIPCMFIIVYFQLTVLSVGPLTFVLWTLKNK